MSSDDTRSMDILADAEEFKAGAEYGSKYEIYQAMRSSRYHCDPVYHAKVDEKVARSLAGREVPNIHVEPRNARFAVAKRTYDADGNRAGTEAYEVEYDGQTFSEDASAAVDTSDGPVFERLPGGVMRATVRHMTGGSNGSNVGRGTKSKQPVAAPQPEKEELFRNDLGHWTLIKPLPDPKKK